MKVPFDKQTLILITTKYLSYLINIAIVVIFLGGVASWIFLLYKSSQ